MLFSEKVTQDKKWIYDALDNLAGEITFESPQKLDKNDLDIITAYIEKQPSGKGKVKYRKNNLLCDVKYSFIKREKWEEDEK